VKAALTGHLVLSTLHTNDAPSTVSRMVNMGIEPFLVGTAVNLIQAQRLVRRICTQCTVDVTKDIHSQSLVEAGFEPKERARCASSAAVAAPPATAAATRAGWASTR
jgi:type IV pilus assembly protein PilB